MNHLFILSGPGGAGKDAIINKLLEDKSLNVTRLVNYTSREMRVGESNGELYHFLTKSEFEHRINNNMMLEYELMESNHQFYGTDKNGLIKQLDETNLITNKMVGGALKLKEILGEQVVLIFIDADDDELMRRLLENDRHLEHAIADRRMEQARHEREYKDRYQHIIENHDGQLDQTVLKVKSIIQDLALKNG